MALRIHDQAPLVHTARGTRSRRIPAMDLGTYVRPHLQGNRGLAVRAAWYVTSALLFQNALLGLLPSSLKARILRAFGARVGRALVCRPRVSIKYPWFLELGDHVWLGQGVSIDNPCPVVIGSHVCISQGALLITGNHDWNDPAFRFNGAPMVIGDGAWIGARALVGPGSRLPPGTVLGCGMVVCGRP